VLSIGFIVGKSTTSLELSNHDENKIINPVLLDILIEVLGRTFVCFPIGESNWFVFQISFVLLLTYIFLAVLFVIDKI